MRTSSRFTLTTISSLLLLFIVGLALRGLGNIPTHAASAPTNWVQSGFNRQHTGYNPFETTISPSNVTQLTLAWTMYADGATNSTPIENNGLLYFSSYNDTLYAVDASTGADVWKLPSHGNGYGTSAVIANGILYSGAANGTLYAVNASTGKAIWSYSLGTNLAASPLYANGIIYIGSLNDRLYAFKATSGKVLWSAPTSSSIIRTAAFDNGLVYVDSGGGGYNSSPITLYVLNGTTGKFLWKYAVSGYPVESPVVANGLVYISTSVIIALNEITGKQVWSYVSPNNSGPGCGYYGCTAEVSPVAEANGDVFFTDGYGNLLTLNALTGQSVWSFEDNGVGLNIGFTPIVANGVVYAGGAEQDPTGSVLYAFNESTGTALWWQQDNASTNIGTSPVVVNGMLFFGTGEDSAMWAYRL